MLLLLFLFLYIISTRFFLVLHPNTCLQLVINPLWDNVWVEILPSECIIQQSQDDSQYQMNEKKDLHLHFHPIQVYTSTLNNILEDDLEYMESSLKNDTLFYSKCNKGRFNAKLLESDPSFISSLPGNMIYYDKCIITLSPNCVIVFNWKSFLQINLLQNTSRITIIL